MSFQLHPDLQRDGILVGQFPLCLVLLINDSAYPWFVLVPQRMELRDAIDLAVADYDQLWAESRLFSQALRDLYEGDKLNIAALGNITPQLHVHHIVRFQGDPAWPGPIWGKQPLVPYSDEAISEIRRRLATAGIDQYSAKME